MNNINKITYNNNIIKYRERGNTEKLGASPGF